MLAGEDFGALKVAILVFVEFHAVGGIFKSDPHIPKDHRVFTRLIPINGPYGIVRQDQIILLVVDHAVNVDQIHLDIAVGGIFIAFFTVSNSASGCQTAFTPISFFGVNISLGWLAVWIIFSLNEPVLRLDDLLDSGSKILLFGYFCLGFIQRAGQFSVFIVMTGARLKDLRHIFIAEEIAVLVKEVTFRLSVGPQGHVAVSADLRLSHELVR